MNEPDSNPSAARAAPASPWRRLMGITYESIILFGVLWFADYAFSALTQFRGAPGPMRHAFQGFTVLVLGGYFTYFWSGGRHSLPMKTVALRVQDTRGRSLSPWHAAWRFAIALALPVAALAAGTYLSAWAYLGLLLPWAWCLVDPDAQSLYDRLAGTRLIHDPHAARAKSVDV